MKAKRLTIGGARRAALVTALLGMVGGGIAVWSSDDAGGACRQSILIVRVFLAPGVMVEMRLDR